MMDALVAALAKTAGEAWSDAAAAAWWRFLGFARAEMIVGARAAAGAVTEPG